MTRFINIFFSAFFLLLLVPVFALLTMLILMLDGFPVLFKQPRLGKGRMVFLIYKFKSMKNGKVTKLGKLIRITGLDELPQLFNILKGDMNFIGPRPLTIEDVTRLEWHHQYYDERWSVLPGITGLSQLSPKCHKKITWLYDRYYVNNKSFGMDVKIILASFGVVLLGKERLKKII